MRTRDDGVSCEMMERVEVNDGSKWIFETGAFSICDLKCVLASRFLGLLTAVLCYTSPVLYYYCVFLLLL